MTTPTTSTATTKGLSEYSEAVQHDVAKTREIVAELHAELPRWGLVVWTAGNVSQRVVVDPESGPGPDDLFVIKPSGVSYDDLTPEAMVVCNTEGELIEGTKLPSSDTAAHAYVYKHMDTVGGIVHTHSTYACAWAALGEEIPCVLTMMADEFGGPVPIGPFAIIGFHRTRNRRHAKREPLPGDSYEKSWSIHRGQGRPRGGQSRSDGRRSS